MRVNIKITTCEIEVSARSIGQPKDVAAVMDIAAEHHKQLVERLNVENVELLKAKEGAMRAQAELVGIEMRARLGGQASGE